MLPFMHLVFGIPCCCINTVWVSAMNKHLWRTSVRSFVGTFLTSFWILVCNEDKKSLACKQHALASTLVEICSFFSCRHLPARGYSELDIVMFVPSPYPLTSDPGSAGGEKIDGGSSGHLQLSSDSAEMNGAELIHQWCRNFLITQQMDLSNSCIKQSDI